MLVIVVGIILISSAILYRIEAASNALAVNSAGYQKKQMARNVAQGGVNISLRQLEGTHSWRTAGWSLSMLSGTANIRVFDTTYAGISTAIGIQSLGTVQESSATTTTFCYFPSPFIPPIVKGLVTVNGSENLSGGIVLDGEDHDPGSLTVNPGKGTYGVWTTGSSFTLGSSSSTIGGTSTSGVDHVPANPPDTSVVHVAQIFPGGYPTTPDSAFGGPSMGFPEGTLKAIAKSGLSGGQYVTDPAQLRYPLGGVTYVELPSGSTWTSATITGGGILIVHNSNTSSVFKGAVGTFNGIILADDILNYHGSVWGSLGGFTPTPAGGVLGNGSAEAYYSRKAILNSVGMLTNGTGLKVIAWRE